MAHLVCGVRNHMERKGKADDSITSACTMGPTPTRQCTALNTCFKGLGGSLVTQRLYTVRIAPMSLHWELLWSQQSDGMALTQSKRDRG